MRLRGAARGPELGAGVRLLALDTATELCSAALWLDGAVRTREAWAPRAHGTLLLPMIEELLAESSLALADLDAIAFGRGPGAFTGVRLATAVAQGLGFAAGLPLIPISDLRALAAQALAAQALARPGRVSHALICQDARMDEVYWACFERTAHTVRLVGEEAVAAPEAVRLPPGWSDCATEVVAAGSGFALYPLLESLVSALGSTVTAVLPELRPRALEIAQLASDDGRASAVAPESAQPVYLRDRVTAGS